MLYLTEQDVLRLLDMPRAISLMREAFSGLAAGRVVNHPRRRLILPTGSVLHYMAAGNQAYYGAKVYSSNPKTGAHFLFLLYRSDDATPLAIIEANHLGQIRTGAASGYATDVGVARPDAYIPGVIGSGFQAETQAAAVAAIRPLTEIRVWSRKPDRREAFAAKLRRRRLPRREGRRIRRVRRSRCRYPHYRNQRQGSGIRRSLGDARHAHQCGRLEPGQAPRTSAGNTTPRRRDRGRFKGTG